MIEEITEYSFTYSPWNPNFPIRSCILIIRATSRKEAELIAMDNGYKFFDQDCTVVVQETRQGYKQV